MVKFNTTILLQIHNELQKDNLIRFFEHHSNLVENIIVYDLASTDGSYEYAKLFTPFVFRSGINDFENEMYYKSYLLEYARKIGSEFVLFLDADEILNTNKTMLNNMCLFLEKENYDAGSFPQMNFWRSNSHIRLDSKYGNARFVRLWKLTSKVKFKNTTKGLHQKHYPNGLKRIYPFDIEVLHYGFSNEKNLSFKFLNYRKHGQSGENLTRIIDEKSLKLLEVPSFKFPSKLIPNSEKPIAKSFNQSLDYINSYREEFKKPSYSIICLIYKSPEWAEFVFKQIHKYTDMRDSEFFFVANNANDVVINYLKINHIPFIEHINPPVENEWYINNVYRAYNLGAKHAKGKNLIFINSDMAFSPSWMNNLIKFHSNNIVSSRLIESGRLKSGIYGIEKSFGLTVSSYKEKAFLRYSRKIKSASSKPNGLFMPLLISKSDFIKVGGYPEGNLYGPIDNNKIAKKYEQNTPGDKVLISRLADAGINHVTSFDSIVYHFQNGEMVDEVSHNYKGFKIAICNDVVGSSIGTEKVLWNHLMEDFNNTIAIDNPYFNNHISSPYYSKLAKRKIKQESEIRLIIQNASYIDKLADDIFTIAILHDIYDSKSLIYKKQVEVLQKSQILIASSNETVEAYRDFNFEVIPIGVDIEIFRPMNKQNVRNKYGLEQIKKIGIFVGSLNETKGWQEIKDIILKFSNIHFIIVSKYSEKFNASNVTFFSKISHEVLAELYNCADFFLIGSPKEAQCLAALEACACNVPVLMHDVGYFKNLTQEEKDQVGIITSLDLELFIPDILKQTFSPRNMIINNKLTLRDMNIKWKYLINENISNIHNYYYNNSLYNIIKKKKRPNFKVNLKFKLYRLVKIIIFDYPDLFRILKNIIPSNYLHKIQRKLESDK